jgi:hypothetical protein
MGSNPPGLFIKIKDLEHAKSEGMFNIPLHVKLINLQTTQKTLLGDTIATGIVAD